MSETTSQYQTPYLPSNLIINSWNDLSEFFEELSHRELNDVRKLRKWLNDRSELEAVVQEDLGWRYIRQTCDTVSEEKRAALNFFIQEIEPHLAEYADLFNRKLLSNDHLEELSQDATFAVYIRGVRKEAELFRKENIPLFTEIQTLASDYGRITGAMSVEIDGKTLTFQQAANLLKSEDREVRRSVYEKINSRRKQDQEALDTLFDQLLALRHQVALNTGYRNFSEYMFDAMGRFDYTAEQCFNFHQSVEEFVVPLVEEWEEARRVKLGLDVLSPWDLEVDADKKEPLEPFTDSRDLIEKTIACFAKVKSSYGDVIRLMDTKGHLDLDSRLGKAPGGYNYPLYASALPFIFMNAAGSIRDMITMMHEGGHALHSWVSKDLELTGFKSTPSEIAEVASMAMELISMEHWDVFFENEEQLNRARHYQTEKIISILPWIATVDAFQHWIYENPAHTRTERNDAWKKIHKRFAGKVIDRSSYPEFEETAWHKQLHIYEVPFYYIEYGIAQLGAIGVWRNYKANPQKALSDYEQALALGYTKTLPELYEIAGVKFDFSTENVKALLDFVRNEI
jgi:oligoendopeptidase F